MTTLPTPMFFRNPDGESCGQCVWRMTLETFNLGQTWPFDTINTIIRKEPGKYIWAQTFFPTMAANGIAIHQIGTWDDARFAADTWDYMRTLVSEEVVQDQMQKVPDMDFVLESVRAVAAHPAITREVRPGTFDDIDLWLKRGAYAYCLVNSWELNEPGSGKISSHAVLVYGLEGNDVIFHDPGGNAPPRPSRRIPRTDFAAAWKIFDNDVTMLSKR